MYRIVNAKEILEIIIKNYIYIVLTCIFFAGISFILGNFFVEKNYSATATILINQKTADVDDSYSKLQSDLQLVNTYKVISTQPVILNQVTNRFNSKKSQNYFKKISADELQKMVLIKNDVNSQILKVEITSDNRNESIELANMLTSEIKTQGKKIMGDENVRIISTASLDNWKPIPNLLNIVFSGILSGFVFSTFVLIIKNFFKLPVRNTAFFEDDLDIHFLGTVHFKSSRKV